MTNFEESVNQLLKPGTTAAKVIYGTLFFLAGMLLVQIGFWNTLLVAALTALGVLLGSSLDLRRDVTAAFNKVVPPKNQRVTYSAEDMEKVRRTVALHEREKKTASESEAEAEKPAEEETSAKAAETTTKRTAREPKGGETKAGKEAKAKSEANP